MVKTWLKTYLAEKFPELGFDVMVPPNSDMGDYSVNIPFALAKKNGKNPMEVGPSLVLELSADTQLKEIFSVIVFAKPGFINFTIDKNYIAREALKIAGGVIEVPKIGNKKINIEFVSANPTGPITFGNARAGSYGDTLGNILKCSGFEVAKEYYINDMGVQIKRLGESFYKKFLKNYKHQEVEFGEDLYQGEYVDVFVKKIVDDLGMQVAEGMSQDSWAMEAVEMMINGARESMKNLGVMYDMWFYESDLHKNGEVNRALQDLEASKNVFEKDGARWLKIDEEKSAVLVKGDGTTTYLMNDIAYSKNKFDRGFDHLINIWGADHHDAVPRLKAGVKAIGFNPDNLEVLLNQLVFIKKDGELQRMSKRKGEFVLLDEMLNEVGKDAIRYFFLTKDLSTHMEFDIDLAKEQSKKNPIYYIQYAFARIHSIFEKTGNATFESFEIQNESELSLSRHVIRFADVINDIALDYSVHHLAQYAYDLATEFHKFYEKERIIEEGKVNHNRLLLVAAVKNTLKKSLDLMGISSPEKM